MIHAPNVLLVGGSGNGKTTSLRTIVRMGLELFVVFTEPHMDMVLDPLLPHEAAAGEPPLDVSRVHYAYVPPTTGTWNEILQRNQMLAALPWDSISKITTDPNKARYNAWQKLVYTFHNFHCDHCGRDFGDVTTWDYSRALAIDSMTGINTEAMQFLTGGAIARTQPQWGAAMALELELCGGKLCYDTHCLYVLTAHLDSYQDTESGRTMLKPLCLGQKVAPELPKNFNDVVHCVRSGDKFYWSTTSFNVDLKGRNLPLSATLPPDFRPLLQTWAQRVFPRKQ